jgi:hypothetical protein
MTVAMECFGNHQTGNFKCNGCWLRECCKLAGNQQEIDLPTKMKNDVLLLRRFDGTTLAEKKIGYNRSLMEFVRAD